MGSRFVLSLGMAGLALATAVAPRAEAQSANPVTVCRNGTRMNSKDSHACEGRGGTDLRATAIARHDEEVRAQNARDEAVRQQIARDQAARGQNRDERYGRNDRDDRDDRYGHNDRNNGRWGDRRSNDPRYDPNNRNGRYGPREVYRWQGYVDKEIRIQLQGSHAYVRPMGGGDVRASRGQMLGVLPHQEGILRVERLEGRGDVDVIEQPSSRNGYTAILRVRDSRGGSSPYRIVAYWEPANRYGYGRN
jgi:hypothetical protein